MIEEMELRGMAPATKKSYLVGCRVLVSHFMKSPEQLRADDVKSFFVYLMRERGAGPATVRGYAAAITFLYRHVLRIRRWWRNCHVRGCPSAYSGVTWARIPDGPGH